MFLLGSFPIGFVQMNVFRNCQEICVIFDVFSLKWALWIIFGIFFRLWVFPASVLFLRFCLLTAYYLECLVLEKSTLPDKIDWNFPFNHSYSRELWVNGYLTNQNICWLLCDHVFFMLTAEQALVLIGSWARVRLTCSKQGWVVRKWVKANPN